MNVTPQDIADRYSILRLKHERLPYNDNVESELAEYRKGIALESIDPELIAELYIINGSIWSEEAAIRQGKERALIPHDSLRHMEIEELIVLAEVGRRALMIRQLNHNRIAVKNKIAKLTGAHLERKGDHASA